MQLDSKDEELRAIAKASKRDKMTKIHIEVCATDRPPPALSGAVRK